MTRPLITVRDLTIGHEGRVLCDGISFDIRQGDCIMLCGANGSGKTTLLKAILRLNGKDVVMIPTRIPKAAGFTLKEFVRICCFSMSDTGGHLSEADEKALDRALDETGLSSLSDRDISTLSDGEFQKASIVSAIIRKASVILLDEPTAFLDAENRISVLRTLRGLCRNAAVVFSTHDLHDGLTVATKVFAIGADRRFRCAEEDKEKCIETIFHKV